MEQPQRKRTFTFVNYGGSYQLRIDDAEDLRHLDNLDDPFWMATSAPTDQMICDSGALEFLDSSGNGRIISGELRQARQWLFRVLKNLDGVSEGREVLELESREARVRYRGSFHIDSYSPIYRAEFTSEPT